MCPPAHYHHHALILFLFSLPSSRFLLILKSKLNQLAHAHIFCFVLLDKLGRCNILTTFLKVHSPQKLAQ